MKNTDMLEWMNDLDASYLREAAEPVIRQHKPIKKHLTAAIAAAAAAACLAVGVGAYGYYHKASVQKYLGMDGEKLLAEYNIAEPAVFTNGQVTFTVDALLFDGHAANVIVTVESLDTNVLFPHDNGFMPEILCDADGNEIEVDLDNKYLNGYSSLCFWNESDEPSAQTRFLMHFPHMEDWDGETLYFRYANPDEPEYDYTKRNEAEVACRSLLDGLIIALPMVKNCECCTMTAESGESVYLSDFELILPPGSDPAQMQFNLIGNNGSRLPVYIFGAYFEGGPIEDNRDVLVTLSTNSSRHWNAPDFNSYFRTDQISAIEIDGVIYEKQE